MIKKIILAIALAFLIGESTFAQIRGNVGVGGYITTDFGGGVEAFVMGIKAASLKTPYFGGGAFVFFDGVFIETNVGFFVVGGEWENYGYSVGTYKLDVSGIGIDTGILGKYPFHINERLDLFPLLGITYRQFVSMEIDGVDYWNPKIDALWFKFGSGLDYSLSDRIYLRWEFLYGIRLSNKFEDESVDDIKYQGATSADTLRGHGIEIKVAVGYKFKIK